MSGHYIAACDPEEFGRFTMHILYDTDAESPDEWDDREVFLGQVRTKHAEFGREGWDLIGYDPEEFEQEEGVWLLPAWLNSEQVLYHLFPVRCIRGQGGSELYGIEEIDRAEGFIFVRARSDLERLADLDEGGTADEKAARTMELWNQWLQGDVYGYEVRDVKGEVVASCWGFYGMEDCMNEGRSAARFEMSRKEVRDE